MPPGRSRAGFPAPSTALLIGQPGDEGSIELADSVVIEAAGRDWSKFGISASVNTGKGTPDDCVKEAEEWRALGAAHLSIRTRVGHLPSPDGHIHRLREAKDALGVGHSHDG